MAGMPSRFATEDWRTVPFGNQGKTLLHQLVDIILFVPLGLLKAGQIGPIDQTVLKIAKSDSLPVGLEQNYRQLLAQLEKWWKAYESTPPEESEVLFTIDGSDSKEYKKVPGSQYSPTLFIQRDSITAFTVSLYNTTSIIIHTILHALSIASDRIGQPSSPPGNSTYHLKQAIVHSNSILEISMHQHAQKPNGMLDFMRTMFPLKLVQMLSPPEQSVKATNLIRQYHEENVNRNNWTPAAGESYPVGPAHSTALRVAAMQIKTETG
jgi:hypothetical protein